MRIFGLIGYPLGHSFSKGYFSEKFKREEINDAQYELFELRDIGEFAALKSKPGLRGLNVTIPYKTAVIPHLDSIDKKAQRIGAVNVIAFRNEGLKGYNSDYYGFKMSLEDMLGTAKPSALILGTGGSSKAVRTVLEDLMISYRMVSRTRSENAIAYEDIGDLQQYGLIINTTPLGMHPDTESAPKLDYETIGPQHILFDLIYNPEETRFLREGAARGAQTRNGLEMLYLQAEKSWEIWNS